MLLVGICNTRPSGSSLLLCLYGWSTEFVYKDISLKQATGPRPQIKYKEQDRVVEWGRDGVFSQTPLAEELLSML
jgi:hypothetical protein